MDIVITSFKIKRIKDSSDWKLYFHQGTITEIEYAMEIGKPVKYLEKPCSKA